MITCTCVRCGKQFEADHKTSVCPECGTTGVCAVCGKEFELKWPYTAKTCSAKCRGILRKQSGQGKEIAKKSFETKKERYNEESVNVSLKPKKCAYCGKTFIPTSNNQKYCGDDYGNCPVCGKRIKIKDMNIGVQACSYECRQKLIEKTNEKRYGVKNVFQFDKVKEKSRKTNLDKYGKERYQSTDEYREKYLDTMNKRYGVDAPLQNDEIKKKCVETNQDRYGTSYPTQNVEVKKKVKDTLEERYGGIGLGSKVISEKIKSTNLDRYGSENVLQNDEIREEIKETNLDKYGYENPMQNEDVKHKQNETNLDRYGSISPFGNKEVQQKVKDTVEDRYGVDNVFQSDEIKDKVEATNVEKYGVSNPMQNEDIKEKAKKTNRERYGADYWGASDERLKLLMKDPSKLDNFKLFRVDPRSFIENNFDHNPTLNQLAEYTGVEVSTVCYHVLDKKCEDLITYNVSNMELEVKDFILSLDGNIKIIMHDRNKIKPLELDIYLPDYNFAIECDPTYTHNSTSSSFNAPGPIPINYHQNKSIACEEKGIFLFHIFGYEWTNKKDIILSMIKNILGKNDNVIYGRDTYVCEISQNELSEFLNSNHRQGATTAKIRLGLRRKNDDMLVSVMSFSGLRSTLGNTSNSSKDDIELSRFCSLLNTTVVGGASKLFKYFKDNYEYGKIVSFSDVAHTKGTLYSNLGFKKISVSSPGYVWVDSKTDRYYNRVQCQKRNLRKLFNDDTIDIDNESESQIMKEHGFVKVYDCGVIRWEYCDE